MHLCDIDGLLARRQLLVKFHQLASKYCIIAGVDEVIGGLCQNLHTKVDTVNVELSFSLSLCFPLNVLPASQSAACSGHRFHSVGANESWQTICSYATCSPSVPFLIDWMHGAIYAVYRDLLSIWLDATDQLAGPLAPLASAAPVLGALHAWARLRQLRQLMQKMLLSVSWAPFLLYTNCEKLAKLY